MNHGFRGAAIHFFRALGTRGHVTVNTGLVASVSDVDLKRFETRSLDGREIGIDQQWQRIVHQQLRALLRGYFFTFAASSGTSYGGYSFRNMPCRWDLVILAAGLDKHHGE
jgi:hypothetical protein